MTPPSRRSGPRLFASLLLNGQRVDWKYSLVVVLVITGMFSTPLALGSIRNRVYVAVKEQIEKENNAREIGIHQARDDAPALDEGTLADLAARYPGTRAVGNHKLVVSVEGPKGSDFLTMQTLTPGDPRQEALQIAGGVPAGFGLRDLVVSDSLGQLLYGESWEELWSPRSGEFLGPPLRLAINELPVAGELRPVARRALPGRGLYASLAAGRELRRYTQGFGSGVFGLPVDEGLVRFALPRLTAASCTLLLPASDPTCGEEARSRLRQRLGELQLGVEALARPPFPLAEGTGALRVRLTELAEEGGRTVVREAPGDCRGFLSPHLVDRCAGAAVLPDVTVSVTLAGGAGGPFETTLLGLDAEGLARIPSVEEMRDTRGAAPAPESGAIALVVPVSAGLGLGEELEIGLPPASASVPGAVVGFYDCSDPGPCPAFAPTLEVFRLQNLLAGSIEVASRDPLVFVPADAGGGFDEVLLYAPRVEAVPALAERLRAELPGYSIHYNVAAIDKLRRQDSRLTTLFTLTTTLSAVFIVLALGSLAQINVERRSRQMAQMLILGFSRGFVRRLIVAEYMLLTLLSALASLGLTAFLCSAARRLLQASADGAARGFEVLVAAMGVDGRAFLLVLAIVAACSGLIAAVSARRAAKTDPLSLLD